MRVAAVLLLVLSVLVGTFAADATLRGVSGSSGVSGDCVGSWSAWEPAVCPQGTTEQNRTLKVTTGAVAGGEECDQVDVSHGDAFCGQQRFQGRSRGGVTDKGHYACNRAEGGICDYGSHGKTACSARFLQNVELETWRDVKAIGSWCCLPSQAYREDRVSGATKGTESRPCPTNCVGAWSKPGECNKVTGEQTATFVISVWAKNGGTQCEANDEDTRATTCTVDCTGSWSDWSICNKQLHPKYDAGKEYERSTRKFTVQHQPLNGGKACPSSFSRDDAQYCAHPALQGRSKKGTTKGSKDCWRNTDARCEYGKPGKEFCHHRANPAGEDWRSVKNLASYCCVARDKTVQHQHATESKACINT